MMNVQDTNSEPQNLDRDEAADAILGRWTDGEDLSNEIKDEDATSEDQNETEVEEDETEEADVDEDDDSLEDPDEDEDEDPDDDTEEDDDPKVVSEDNVVDIVVNGESKKVSVKDLKRLYGQEASLTKKSQDLASQRKVTDENLAKTQASYQKLMERAQARHKPYADIDMLVASQQMDADTFAQLRQDARQAEDDLRFLNEESGQMMADMQAQQAQATKQAAAECVKVLEDSLPDWGNDLYSEIRTYAVKSGLPQDQVDQYTSPEVIMLINKARLYDQSKQSAESKKAKAKVTKSKSGKTKVLSSRKAPPSKSQIREGKRNAAHQKLIDNPRDGGSTDDIAEALMARWAD